MKDDINLIRMKVDTLAVIVYFFTLTDWLLCIFDYKISNNSKVNKKHYIKVEGHRIVDYYNSIH